MRNPPPLPRLFLAALFALLSVLLLAGCTLPAPASGSAAPQGGGPVCTDEWNPVCGPEGTTYANPCTAQAAGATPYVVGPCPTQPPAPVPPAPAPNQTNRSGSDVQASARPSDEPPALLPAKSTPSCRLNLSRSSIPVGGAVGIEVHVQAASFEKATYLCGTQERTMGQGGNFNDYRLCTFNQTGRVVVWAALNGRVCAWDELTVEAPPGSPVASPARSCLVVPDSRKRSVSEQSSFYEAQVRYAGYKAGQILSWKCRDKTYRVTLSADPLSSDPLLSGVYVVNCEYLNKYGTTNSIPVSMDGDVCGDLIKP